MVYKSLRLASLWAALSFVAACGGGSSGGQQGGGLSARALWQQPNDTASIAAGDPLQQSGSDGFGPELPGSARTVRFVFSPSSGDACCVAVDPQSIPVNQSEQQRVLVLPQLPVGPGSLVISAFPTDFAPAPAGITTTCATRPAEVGQPCDQTRTQTQSFSSDPQPVNIRLGIDSDAGDILVRSFPFIVPGTLSPAENEDAGNPVAAAFTIADAVSGIDASSIMLQLSSNGVPTSEQPLQLAPCDDAGGDPCSSGGDLQVTGFAVTRPAQELVPGGAQGRIRAANLGSPPQSVDLRYQFVVSASVRTATATVAPTLTVRPTVTRTPPAGSTATATRTATAIPSRTPSATRRATSTAIGTRTRTPTPGPSPSPTIIFVGALPSTVSARPEFLTTADLNLDGLADLVVVSPLSQELNVLVGSSESATGFSSLTVFRFGDRLRNPAVGDLNADGNPDIVVADSGNAGVWVLLGNGDATFVTPSFFPVGGSPFAVAVADFDGQPGDDFVVADRQRDSVLLRLSNGTTPLGFSDGPELSSGDDPMEVLAVDLNRDGQADIAALNVGGEPTVGVLLWQSVNGNGSPVFASVASYGAGARPEALTATDLDGDGGDDLVLLNRPLGSASNDLAVFLSHEDGSLDALPSLTLACPFVATGACPSRAIAPGDFQQDGNVDLAVVFVDPRGSSTGDGVRVLQGKGDGSFANGPVFPVADEASAISPGDYGGNGRVDLAVSSLSDVSVQVLVNVSILASGGNAEAIAFGEDGLPSLRYGR